MRGATEPEGDRMTVTDTALRGVPLFSGMTDRALDAISELVSPRAFVADDDLVREGEPGESFLIIRAGSAVVLKDDRQIGELGPGDFLGEISLIDGGPRTATVRATAPIDALVIGRDDFATLLDGHPAVRLELLMALTARIRRSEGSPTA
jgi:CRP/FNR family cyclic AMP-dependent transcriptional regulator